MASESSDDDDIPLGQLVAPMVRAIQEKSSSNSNVLQNIGQKRKSPDHSAVASRKEKRAAPAAARNRRAAPPPAAAAPKAKTASKDGSDAFYADCVKGQLVQKLICRWWYAIDWPSPADLAKPVPAEYEPLDGYPGVYICIKGGEMGNIIDHRDHENGPSFSNFKAKNSGELKELLLKALDTQKERLVEHEGPNSTYLRAINKEITWASKVNAEKADKEARKF
uniref:Uncharacterized protein n=1 Tax=Rhizochromulina marina TaxID=1034831 RepID=A0A7S2WPV8_9STRA|mmetsp:Transcript_30952/g.89898  ORF Transcript_30952/g.89898 Transcript_30952/m.89898 type:complete len:223 (+) Transcript_30952:32-700(+)